MTDPAHFRPDTNAQSTGAYYDMPREPIGGWAEDDRDPQTLAGQSFEPPTSSLGETGRPQHVPQGAGSRFIHDGDWHPDFYDPDAGQPQPYPA